jgi:hypothetical protein
VISLNLRKAREAARAVKANQKIKKVVKAKV